MKCYEVKKGFDPKSYGKVMMAVEGPKDRIEAAELKLEDEGFDSSKCTEDGEKEGDIVIFFIVNRADVYDFRATWKQTKAAV